MALKASRQAATVSRAGGSPAPVSLKKRARAWVYFWMVAGLYSRWVSHARYCARIVSRFMGCLLCGVRVVPFIMPQNAAFQI